MLPPELTASATAREAAAVAEREFAAYVSANRTCELRTIRAPGKHILKVVERSTR